MSYRTSHYALFSKIIIMLIYQYVIRDRTSVILIFTINLFLFKLLIEFLMDEYELLNNDLNIY